MKFIEKNNNKFLVRLIASCAIIIVAVCIFLFFMNSQTPEYIAERTQGYQQKGYIEEVQKSYYFRFYLPANVSKELLSIIESKTQEISENYQQKYSNLGNKVFLRGETNFMELSNGIVNVHYYISVKESKEIEKIYQESYFYNTSTSEWLTAQQRIDERNYHRIQSVFRNRVKQTERFGELGYTMEFIDRTNQGVDLFSHYILKENEVEFYINDFFDEPFSFTMNVQEFAQDNLPGITVTPDANYVREARYINPNRKIVAVSYDDGPKQSNTGRISAILQENHASATFFVVGNRIRGNEVQTILNTIEKQNEIGSHSWSHAYLTKISDEKMMSEFQMTSDKVREITNGEYEIKVYRPPYGSVNGHVKGMSPFPLIMWSIDPQDWKIKKSEEIQSTIESIMSKIQDGDIILLHDLPATTVELTEILIPKLIKEGYQITSVSELAAVKSVELLAGETIYKIR